MSLETSSWESVEIKTQIIIQSTVPVLSASARILKGQGYQAFLRERAGTVF
jgi:hypothetical protein